MAIIVVPFTMFYYEGMDEKDDYDADGGNTTKQVFYAVKWSTITIGVFLVAAGVMWYKIGYAQFDITQQNGMFQQVTGNAIQYCVPGSTDNLVSRPNRPDILLCIFVKNYV